MFTYDEAMSQVDDLISKAIEERTAAARHGADSPLGDASLRFAAQYAAEAQVWATVALATTSRNQEMMQAGV